MLGEFKNKFGFFLISFLISFGAIFILQNRLPDLITNDLIAYVMSVFLIGLIPAGLFFIWNKNNPWLSFCLYFVCLMIIILAIPTINFFPIRQFFVLNILAIIWVIVLSLIGTLCLNVDFKKLRINRTKERFIFQYVAYFLVFLIIAFLIYNPKYKYSFEKLSLFGYESYYQFHHVTFYLIPVYEILKGKTLLVNVSSLYGILVTYINSLIFKIFGLSYSNFVLYDMIVSIIYTGIFFVVLKKASRSFWLSLIGTLAFIRLAFYRDFPANIEIFIFPSTTPIRDFFDIIIFFLIFQYFNHRPDRKVFLIMTSMVVLGFFYGFDFGLLMLLAYISTLAYDILLDLLNREKLVNIIAKINRFFFPLLSMTFAGWLFTVGFTFIRSAYLPDFSQYFFHIATQTVQLNDRSLPAVVGWHYLPLSVYLIGFYYLFYQTLVRQKKNYHWLVFLIVYGVLSFTYYINLSEPNHLFSIMQPAIFILVLLTAEMRDYIVQTSKKKDILLILFSLIFFFGLSWGIFLTPQPFINMIIDKVSYRYSPVTVRYFYWPYSGMDFYLQDDDGKNFKIAADAIKKYAKHNSQVVIVSRYAPLLYMMSGKTSLIDHPNIENDIYSVQEFNRAVNLIINIKPRYIFVHSPNYSQWYADIMNQLWNKVESNYVFLQRFGAVDVYQLK